MEPRGQSRLQSQRRSWQLELPPAGTPYRLVAPELAGDEAGDLALGYRRVVHERRERDAHLLERQCRSFFPSRRRSSTRNHNASMLSVM